MEAWVTTSALMITIPQEMGEKIDLIRRKYDRAYQSWMPHLNIFYPFLEEDEEDESLYQKKLREASAALQNHPRLGQFVMWFDHLSSFQQPQGMQTVHLVPKTDPPEALAELRKFLATILVDPHPKNRGYNPHLTIGQWDKSVQLSDVEKLFPSVFDDVLHVPFTVKQLTAASRRHTERFLPVAELLLKETETLGRHWEAQLGTSSSTTDGAQLRNVIYVPKEDGEASSSSSSSASDVMVQLVISQQQLSTGKRKKIVLVCDTSGSMTSPSPVPKEQVLGVVKELESEGFDFSIINYSKMAFLTPGSWEALNSRWQGSTTCFRTAFYEMIRFIEENPRESIEFIFLTDGQATDKPMDTAISPNDRNYWQLVNCIKKESSSDRSIIVHTFGLGQSSDLSLLETLRQVGSEPGIYTFASVRNGEQEIFSELNDMISFSRLHEFDISIDGECAYPCKFSKLDENHLETVLWLQKAPKSIRVIEKYSGNTLVVDDFEVRTASKASTQYHLSKIRRDMSDVRDPEVVLQLERRLEKVRWDCPRRERAVLFTECLQVGRELDELRTLLISQTKGAMYKTSELLSRLNALAFKGMMRKARRRRLLDARALANQELISSIDELLEALPVPTDIPDVADLRDDISQDTLGDILTLSKQDLLMIGLQVKRDELTIDQPICINVKLCNTMVSWLTLEHAATFEIAKGNTDATGTFDIKSVTKLLTGTSNEIINAGLPIYGCEAHYQRIRIWMPVICGHFFTLNEMGFSPKQILALYAILARLHQKASNQRALLFVEQFRLLLARIAHDLPLLQILRVPKAMQPITMLRRFISDPNARNKSELPTLEIIAGLILALKPSEECLGPSSSNDITSEQQTLIPPTMPAMMVAETLRRHMNLIMVQQGGGAEHFHGMIRRMIFGDQKANFAVEVSVPVIFDSASGTFTTCQFTEYQSLQPPETIFFNDKDLEAQKIPATAAEFLKKFPTVFPFTSLDDQMYQRILPACILQAAWGANNDKYRQMIDSGLTIMDPLMEPEQTHKLILHIVNYFDLERRGRWLQACADQLDEEMALTLIHEAQVDEFVGSLRNLGISRNLGLWKHMVEEITNDDTYENILGNHEKLAVMLFGKYQDQSIIEDGAAWMAGPIRGRFIREKLSVIYRDELEQLDSECAMHQYRATDVPNRHGHHRSFPLWAHYNEHPSIRDLIKRWDR